MNGKNKRMRRIGTDDDNKSPRTSRTQPPRIAPAAAVTSWSRRTARAATPHAPPPLLLTNIAGARVLGVSLNRYYELRRNDPRFPRPVALPLRDADHRRRELRSLEDMQRYVRELARDRAEDIEPVGADADDSIDITN